ncbi:MULTISPECIES: hypothetical protein [unclassified Psychrobacter]|uniref:hypothetical protein n=1 Tax=unclassified Psychrobacter TaxID=196806 RepID=UPI0025D2C43F|nr:MULTISPECIES: hypothetical protein [unclassified Psychrobacter]
MNHQADNWEWAQHDVHDTLSCKMTDSEQAAFIKSQQEISSRLGMTFDELIASMQSGEMKRQAIKQTEKES